MSNPWCSPEKGKDEVMGEIFFSPKSTDLGTGDKAALNKLTDVLATLHGQLHDFEKPSLLILGDTDATEAPRPDPELGKRRAAAVEQYIRSKLPQAAASNVKIESAGKGGATLPGMKPAPNQVRRRVAQLVNKGKPIKAMTPPLKKAGSLAEALQVAQQVFRQRPPEHQNQANRIRHWLEGPGKASIERGDDAFLTATQQVRDLAQAGRGRVSDAEMARLVAGLPRIGPALIEVAAFGNPPDLVRERLISIDELIMGGIDFLIQRKKIEGSSFGSTGLDQLSQFVSRRGDDRSSFYHAYGFGGVPQVPETDTAMGTWRVTAGGKWTWIYELKLGGGATWRDVKNGQTGSGRWQNSGDQIEFFWTGSENKEIWRPLPLTPTGQQGRWTWKDGTSFETNAVREKKF